jgi:hypothetical protein
VTVSANEDPDLCESGRGSAADLFGPDVIIVARVIDGRRDIDEEFRR